MVDICCKNTLMKCTVACSMSWVLNRIETGVDLVLLQTLFSPGSFLLKSQGIEHTTVHWLNTGWKSFFDEQLSLTIYQSDTRYRLFKTTEDFKYAVFLYNVIPLFGGRRYI